MENVNNTSIEYKAETLIQNPSSLDAAIEFVRVIRDDQGTFWAQEDTLFDYKLEFPHSFSDEYFVAICRLCLAFYNSFGGVVVLGVDDKKREGGHNKNIVNIERLNTRLRELTFQMINVKHLRISDNQPTVDLLIIPKRNTGVSPAYLVSQLGKYSQGTLWIRRGHEVLEATSRDIHFVFSPRAGSYSMNRIASYLPPSPSTVSKFVGRVDLLSALLTWVTTRDEPRLFLWGRGGSGKSTVAHEFCQIIREYGRSIKTFSGSPFERVVFLSAKERELNTQKGEIRPTKSVDFSNYPELLGAILVSCDYSAALDTSKLTVNELETHVREIFDFESILIVVDDIDTLTNKGDDAGFDSIYKMCLRAKSTVRVIYTQRNMPVSSESWIQVPGLVKDEDYIEFVQNCCEQFSIPMPEPSFLEGKLKELTECIPLIIETVLRLRRVCGTYKKAQDIFMERQGDEARRYLFEREYEALPSNNNARHILCAISEFNTPVGNEQVGAVVRIGESAVAESIGEVLGFFLSTTISESGETRYFLNPVTRSFVKTKSRSLNFGETITERVKAFKSAGQTRPQEVIILESKVERLLARGEDDAALALVCEHHPAKVVENPSFRMLRATLLSNTSPPRIAEARDDFQYCLDQHYEDASGMRTWYNLERRVGHSYAHQAEICDRVINGKSYAKNIRFEFLSRKGVSLYFKARDLALADSFDVIREALLCHVEAFSYFWSSGSDVNLAHKTLRNTGFALVSCSKQLALDSEVVRVFRDIQRKFGGLADPLFDPFASLVVYLGDGRGGDAGRRREGILKGIKQDFEKGSLKFRSHEQTSAILRMLP